MVLREDHVDRWLERGSRFFRGLVRTPELRATLAERGLTNAELERGFQLFAELHGVGLPLPAKASTPRARRGKQPTRAAEALAKLDAWDGPNFAVARAALKTRCPEVERFLFDHLKAEVSVLAVSSVERFLARLAQLRAGNVPGVSAKSARAGLELVTTRLGLDSAREAELREWIATVRRGAQPDEVPLPRWVPDERRTQTVQSFVAWLQEWRELARVIASREQKIAIGLVLRRPPKRAAS